jgi:hypothetical protein
MLTNQTTIVESAVLPDIGKLGIPGMKLVGWCEDREQQKNKPFAVFFEPDSGNGPVLFLEVELHNGFPPGGGNWAIMSREDVVSIFAGDDPEYEGRSFLASRDAYWKEAVTGKSAGMN